MSTRTVADKLLSKPGPTLWCSDPARLGLLGPLPDGVRPVDDPGEARTALVFADDARTLRQVLTTPRDRLAQPEVFWVAYPKANRTDLNRDSLWPVLGEYGMRPISQVAVDDVGSALRFRPLKEGEPPFTGGRG